MRNIRKKEIIKKIADDAGATQKDVFNIAQRLIDEIVAILVRGDKIELRGFGIFEVVNKKGGTRHNPRTFEKVDVPEKRAVRFRMGKVLKAKMENGHGDII
jgi:nucleoid DNA-binding protein